VITVASKTEQAAQSLEAQPVHDRYKREWLEQILATSPSSVLDVGCGDGALLSAAAAHGCAQCVGLEIDEQLASACRSRGLQVHAGRAECLPFGDRSFDAVTFSYVAHHVEHLDRALMEAARVTRGGVFILDPWYDTSIPSQRVAARFDSWSKSIDRRCGMVHNACVAASGLLAPHQMLGGFRVDYCYRLILQALPLSKMEALAAKQLERIPADSRLQEELYQLLDRARLDGISDDGAIYFRALRN
jgi:ubiquinone/menaquinone biosynthesis C-methylase UbiE